MTWLHPIPKPEPAHRPKRHYGEKGLSHRRMTIPRLRKTIPRLRKTISRLRKTISRRRKTISN